MEIRNLKPRTDIVADTKPYKMYAQFTRLLEELAKKQLPDPITESINKDIDELNAIQGADKELKSMLRKKQMKIVKLLEKELKIVPKNYYSNLWMVLGMTAFGLPLGVVLGNNLDNMGLLSLGLPAGMGIGVLIGMAMDKKALAEGRQLDIVLKY